jgi:hypothetical protein
MELIGELNLRIENLRPQELFEPFFTGVATSIPVLVQGLGVTMARPPGLALPLPRLNEPGMAEVDRTPNSFAFCNMAMNRDGSRPIPVASVVAHFVDAEIQRTLPGKMVLFEGDEFWHDKDGPISEIARIGH